MQKTSRHSRRPFQSHRSTRSASGARAAIAKALEPLEQRVLMTGDVVATVIQDTNKNGVADPGEPGLSGWTVFVDINGNSSKDAGEPFALTDASGVATITSVPAASQIVQEIVPTGYAPAAGFKDFDHVTVHDGRTSIVHFLNISVATTANIQATLWNDVGGHGT